MVCILTQGDVYRGRCVTLDETLGQWKLEKSVRRQVTMRLDQLPEDLLGHILSRTDFKSRCIARKVCRKWNSVVTTLPGLIVELHGGRLGPVELLTPPEKTAAQGVGCLQPQVQLGGR